MDRQYQAVGGTGKRQALISVTLAIVSAIALAVAAYVFMSGDTPDDKIVKPVPDGERERPLELTEDNPFLGSSASGEARQRPLELEADNPFLRSDDTASGVAGASGATDFLVTADCSDCPPMVVIPPGASRMGISEREAAEEQVPRLHIQSELPAHGIMLKDTFAMGQTEVTRAQFAAFADATGYEGRGCTVLRDGLWQFDKYASWQAPGFPQDDDQPVVCVSQADALAYAGWLSERTGKPYRLPSETEWEYAGRARTVSPRYWGDGVAAGRKAACDYANVADETLDAHERREASDLAFPCNDDHTYTAPVGTYRANAFGLFDMLGNVREAVADCWNPNHWGKPFGAAARITDSCNGIVVRGGGWGDAPHNIRAARRMRGAATDRRADQGFRVVKEVPVTVKPE